MARIRNRRCCSSSSATTRSSSRRRPLRLAAKLLLAIAAVGAEYAFLLFVLRLEAVVMELSSTAPALLWATAALGLALFLLYDLCLDRLTALYRRRRK